MINATLMVSILEMARQQIMLGWCKGTFERNSSGKCLIGAVQHATRILAPGTIFIDIWDALDDLVPGNSVVKFNDAPETAQADVINFLNLAISYWTMKEQYEKKPAPEHRNHQSFERCTQESRSRPTTVW